MYGNCNAPPAVTKSAIIYCLRCLVKRDIPLNQGCLNPIGSFLFMLSLFVILFSLVFYCLEMNIPSGSILHPSDTAAVVGGKIFLMLHLFLIKFNFTI